jgi:hypothetical protein
MGSGCTPDRVRIVLRDEIRAKEMPAFLNLEHRVSFAAEGSDSSKTKHQPYLYP